MAYPLHRLLSADEPARAQAEAEAMLRQLPVDPDAVKHRHDMLHAMFDWKQWWQPQRGGS